jgi:hypothetical protein
MANKRSYITFKFYEGLLLRNHDLIATFISCSEGSSWYFIHCLQDRNNILERFLAVQRIEIASVIACQCKKHVHEKLARPTHREPVISRGRAGDGGDAFVIQMSPSLACLCFLLESFSMETSPRTAVCQVSRKIMSHENTTCNIHVFLLGCLAIRGLMGS